MKKILLIGCAVSVFMCAGVSFAQQTPTLGAKTKVVPMGVKTGATSGTLPQAATKPQPKTAEEFAEMAIKENDKNGDGKISKEEYQGPEEAFKAMDASGDGFVTREELIAGVKNAQAQMQSERQQAVEAQEKALVAKMQQQAKSFMERADGDKDGKMSYSEFVESNKARFKELDTNGDGFVTTEELVGDTEKKIESNKMKAAATTETLKSR